MAIEEPAYEVLETEPEYEVRRYAPIVVAELKLDGTFEDVGNDAFRSLAAFINGANEGSAKIDMTAPVTQQRGEEPGEKISMTAPVTQEATSDGKYAIRFVMPSSYTIDSVPRPSDERIRIREEPGRVVAVHRYSGTWSERRYRDRLEKLRAALERDGLTLAPGAEPVWARFNSPFALWFLRRNEIWLPLAWDS